MVERAAGNLDLQKGLEDDDDRDRKQGERPDDTNGPVTPPRTPRRTAKTIVVGR